MESSETEVKAETEVETEAEIEAEISKDVDMESSEAEIEAEISKDVDMESLEAEDIDVNEVAGIGPVTEKKLKNMGVHTVVDLAARTAYELSQHGGLESTLANSIIAESLKTLQETGFLQKSIITATECLDKRKDLERCTTGCKNIDDLLAGGIETRAITEFFGEFGTGKTQIAHTLCVTCQLPKDENGFEGKVLYIDTENTFRPERVQQIAEARNHDSSMILDNILVARAYNASHLELLIRELGSVVRINGVKLVIVDSIISLHRSEFIGRGTLSDRQQRLNALIHALNRVAEIHNCAVVMTNQVQSQPDAFFRDPTKAAGGHVLSHASTYRIYLKKAGKDKVAKMIDSPYHPDGETRFSITEKGVEDSHKE
ncbi:MAG: DNA repair and recombination protein RadA [Thaumarchaeota archaeon]|nr:DNA repair and recombination protein RadA [Nitrososphaerota archaeon]